MREMPFSFVRLSTVGIVAQGAGWAKLSKGLERRLKGAAASFGDAWGTRQQVAQSLLSASEAAPWGRPRAVPPLGPNSVSSMTSSSEIRSRTSIVTGYLKCSAAGSKFTICKRMRRGAGISIVLASKCIQRDQKHRSQRDAAAPTRHDNFGRDLRTRTAPALARCARRRARMRAACAQAKTWKERLLAMPCSCSAWQYVDLPHPAGPITSWICRIGEGGAAQRTPSL